MAPFASSGGLWQKRRAPRDPLPSNGRRPRKPMKTETLATEVPFYPGLSAVADRYDAFIIDLWGVMHDGLRAYPAAVEALRQLRRAGKRSVVLSNAPRSEEHTSELQSLMRISYAVFCLKKKNTPRNNSQRDK